MLFPEREGAGLFIKDTKLFGKYEICAVLGTGSSGSVYLARHQRLNDYRAIKCISKRDLMPSQFLLEGELLKNLNHPGIPIIYDIEEDEEHIYIIEELIRGESIQTAMSDSNYFSIDQVLQTILQLCEILEYLHNQKPYPIVYQDLKPEHVYLTQNQVKLIDFGVAFYWKGQGEGHERFGTPGFAAPEVYQGDSAQIQSDIYGLGAILYFMIYHRKYLGGKSMSTFGLQKGCGRDFRKILKKALAENPQERYRCVQEFRCDLELVARKRETRLMKKHLEGNIAVIGTKTGSGVTHFAISLTSYLNHTRTKAVYHVCTESDWLKRFHRTNSAVSKDGRYYQYHNFRGMEGEASSDQSEILVEDYGADQEQLYETMEEEKLILLILGSNEWEMEDSLAYYRRLSMSQKIIPICGFGRVRVAKLYADQLERKVYSFPMDEDPFRLTRSKIKFFEQLFREQKGEEQD